MSSFFSLCEASDDDMVDESVIVPFVVLYDEDEVFIDSLVNVVELDEL
jgi:hypothetical protein